MYTSRVLEGVYWDNSLKVKKVLLSNGFYGLIFGLMHALSIDTKSSEILTCLDAMHRGQRHLFFFS